MSVQSNMLWFGDWYRFALLGHDDQDFLPPYSESVNYSLSSVTSDLGSHGSDSVRIQWPESRVQSPEYRLDNGFDSTRCAMFNVCRNFVKLFFRFKFSDYTQVKAVSPVCACEGKGRLSLPELKNCDRLSSCRQCQLPSSRLSTDRSRTYQHCLHFLQISN